ncbi:MAG: class I SAM-dependent methyltransferase [Pseudomonadota bacterium]
MSLFNKKKISAYDAIYEAQKIAFAPLIFQAVRSMRDLGVLEQLEQGGESGVSAEEVGEATGLSPYGVKTLLESGLSCGVVEESETGRYQLSKVGYFLLHDKMTRINMDYNHYICYQGMYHLDEAIKEEKPVGLKVFGEQWETLYQALPHLPEPIQKSWYAFDHFYSDSAYPEVLPILFDGKRKRLLDIGTNIGKFTLLAAEHEPEARITMVDLPDQLQNAIANVRQAGLEERVDALALDLLDPQSALPAGFDIYWLSQFLSCFGHAEIVSILKRIAAVMEDDSRVFILETCWDRQQHEASTYSLINTSLYFTAMASGNSKMYSARELLECIEEAGLEPVQLHDNVGLCHTLFECRKRAE